MVSFRRSLYLLLPLAVFSVDFVYAEPGTLALGLKTEYTDNARLVASDEVDDFKNSITLTIDKRDQFGRLDSYLVGEIEYFTYANDSFANSQDGSLLWNGTYNIRPRVLTWGISNELSQVIIDSAESNTPDNRTTRNIFSTGPTYTMNLGRTDFADFTGEYQRTDYQTAGDDSDRYRLISSLTHLMSDQQQVSATYNWTKSLFGSSRELYRNEIYGSYRYNYLKYSFDGSYGITHLKGRNATSEEETDSTTWNMKLSAETSRSSSLNLTYSRELNDSGSGFDQSIGDSIVNLKETSIILLTEWSLQYKKAFANNSSLDARVFHNISEYLISNSDEERNGIELGYKYPLFDRLTLGFSTDYEHVKFTPAERSDDRYGMRVSTDYEYIRNLFFSAEIAQERRDSTLDTFDYTENTIMIGVRYLPTF